jgi:hypothetical protein
MRTAVIAAVIAGVILTCCAYAFPMAAEYRSRTMVQQPSWPEGLADLLNSQTLAYGYWVNSLDYFYYAGDTKAFNEFLERYAKLPMPQLIGREATRTLVLHVGAAETKNFDGKPVACDWLVKGSNFGAFGPEGKALPAGLELEVWVGCHVQLDQLKVPLNIELKSGGEIEKLIGNHQAAQRAGDKPLPHMPEKPQVDGTVER